MPFFNNKRRRYRPKRKMGKTMKVSKTLKRAIKSVVKTVAETKTINCPTTGSTVVNTANLPYTALSGVQYLCNDVFSVPQGIQNDTGVSAPNRIGDKINALGFKMNYYFSIINFYTIGAAVITVPYIKLRVLVFEGKYGAPPPSTALTYDGNFLNGDTSTLQPVNYDAGYVRRVLHDQVHIVRNFNSPTSNTVYQPNKLGNVFHFQKYIKYNKLVSSVDNPNPGGQATKNPIYVTISAELDDAVTGLVPSGTPILFSTGFTQAWFKDS